MDLKTLREKQAARALRLKEKQSEVKKEEIAVEKKKDKKAKKPAKREYMVVEDIESESESVPSEEEIIEEIKD